MPNFETPEPISVTIDFAVGGVRIIASDRADTVVEVRPSDESRATDVRAAERTRVEYSTGKLLVKTPRQRNFIGRSESIDVTIELPTGSHVHVDTAVADFRAEGQLGECKVKTATGDIRFDQTGPLHVNTYGGNVAVDRVAGDAYVSIGSGYARIGVIDGTAAIKNSNGDTNVGEVTGDVLVNAANGSISVDRAHSSVTAKTAKGNVRIGEVVRGSVVLETSYGELEVGIHEGTAAWLDVSSLYGIVHNSLGPSDGPRQSDETVEVRAHTSYGDIVIHRS